MSLTIMRHSLRLDFVEDSTWDDKFTRPYDTPVRCLELPSVQGKKLKQHNITKVIVSPFRRCLQTAAVVCREIGVKEIIVDRNIGETMTAVRYCNNKVNPHLEQSEHTFEYLSEEESVATVKCINPDLHLQSIIGGKPSYDETAEASRERFHKTAFEYIHNIHQTNSNSGDGQLDNLLFIAHGDVVQTLGGSLTRNDIYCVNECGFVVVDASKAVAEAREYSQHVFPLKHFDNVEMM